MRLIAIAVAAAGVTAGTAAEAQYYPPPPPGYYYDEPPRRYRRPPPPPPGYYPPGHYAPRQYAPTGAPTRTRPGDPGYEPWRPRVDPRNGGLYCVQEGFTVQDGVCKPGGGYRRW